MRATRRIFQQLMMPIRRNREIERGQWLHQTLHLFPHRLCLPRESKEGDVVNLIEYHLKKYGYSCLKAYNGLQALKTIESERPDLLILDLMLPQIDGWELCHILRKNSDEKIKNLPIIMLTARASVEDRAYGLEIGADDYMIKPFSIAELIERIKRLLGRQKQDI